ncbi:MAG: SDR family NAD(P)-dependent oxidoreductase [Pseudomonadales bacterium]
MNPFDLTGKVAIVTGGNSGIGLGMARGLSKAGASIAIAARNKSRSQEVVEAFQKENRPAMAVECDVKDAAAIENLMAQVEADFGRIDILVNNAGTSVRKRPEDLSYEDWRHVLDTNIDSAFRCSQAVYPAMKRAGSGKILNNGSMLSLFGSPWGSAYAASKGAMVQLTKSLATAWAEDGIQVNCFLPGWIDTPLTIGARREIPGLEEKITERTPAKRWGHIDDFGGIAVFLASSASDFITGTAIPVDGGFSVTVI